MRIRSLPVASSAAERSYRAGFTLIELTIGAALMALILASAYACLSSGVAARDLLDPRLDALQSARVVMGMIASDLRSAYPLAKETDFVGLDRKLGEVEADNVDFATLNPSPSRPGEGDYCRRSYYLDQDKRSGEWVLWRRSDPGIGLDPFAGGTRDELARGVRQFKLEYYDGFDWYDTWGDAERSGKRESSMRLQSNLSGIPEAVRITLAFAPGWRPDQGDGTDPGGANSDGGLRRRREASGPMVFRTVVRPNASGTSGTSGGGPGTGSGSSQGGGQTGSSSPETPAGGRMR